MSMTIDDMLKQGCPPIIAILRGVAPDEVCAIGHALIDAGIRFIEVPFNSPHPADSITALQNAFGDTALIGGGTIIDRASVDALAKTGGQLLVAPNCNPDIIAYGRSLTMEVVPGVATLTEAFAAIEAGAQHLKLFPAGAFGPSYVRAMCDVLPHHISIWAVGGTGADNLAQWIAAGAAGIGVGGALYRAGDSAQTAQLRAKAIVAAWRDRDMQPCS
jgi:2-dehydro-3-deoxyphosphogalactonate aldolase